MINLNSLRMCRLDQSGSRRCPVMGFRLLASGYKPFHNLTLTLKIFNTILKASDYWTTWKFCQSYVNPMTKLCNDFELNVWQMLSPLVGKARRPHVCLTRYVTYVISRHKRKEYKKDAGFTMTRSDKTRGCDFNSTLHFFFASLVLTLDCIDELDVPLHVWHVTEL